MNDADFLAAVRDDMADIAVTGVNQAGDQFAIWFAVKVLNENLDDVKDRYHIGGSGDNKLDIGILDDDHDTIIIVQCKYSSDPLHSTFDADLPEAAVNARDRLRSIPNEGSPRRRAFAAEYNAASWTVPQRLIAVGFGKFSSTARSYAREHNVELYDYERIKARFELGQQFATQRTPASLTLSIGTRELIHRESTNPRAQEWLTVIDAREVYEAVKQHGHSLFAENLRFKLVAAAKRAIAAEIRNTVRDQPSALLLFNNGLTFVASSVHLSPDRKRLILAHPQIVNGCQTSWAIFEAFSEMHSAKERAARAEILVKIVETADDPKLAEQIAYSTNQQNAISDRDLKANQPIQKTIQLAFDHLRQPVYYEYKEGGSGTLTPTQRAKYNVPVTRGRPPLRTINNISAGQLYLAVMGCPWLSKQGKKLIFSSYYTAIFQVDLDPDVRFGGFETPEVNGGPLAFRDDVVFAFSVYQLAEAIKGLYERKVALYDEGRPALTALQTRAEHMLTTFGVYHKFWQYLLIACVNEIASLWAKRRGVSLAETRVLLLGDDLNPFFASQRLRQEFFDADTNLDHALVLDEGASGSLADFAAWARSIGRQLETLIGKVAIKTVSGIDQWDEKFRMQGFVDQTQQTFKSLKEWILGCYAKGASEWSQTFPLKESESSQRGRRVRSRKLRKRR